VTQHTIEQLVEHMFDQVFSEAERAELLVWITRWEEANPGVDPAHRVTGWIDVAYSFQARIALAREGSDAAATGPQALRTTPAFA
jgi:hypothetical protein